MISSVFRFSQSYRATDAAAAIYHAERDILQFDHWSVEGGVWQTKRVLDILAGRFVSAKGRPNQKLVENYIGRLWDIMAGQAGDVGRHRGEIVHNSDLYISCRQGRKDPRDHFMSLAQGQRSLYDAVDYLAEKRIVSRTYGSWVPKDRWYADLADQDRAPRSNADDFLVMPVAATRTVSNDSITVAEDGPLGVRMQWRFTADWLAAYRKRKVTIYFDPLSEWPVQGVVTLAGQRKPLGEVTCISPLGESSDSAIDLCKSVRQTVLTETRILSKMHQERISRTLRHPSGVAKVGNSTDPTAPSPAPETASPFPSREAIATPSRVSRDDLADRLSRRAARLRGEEIPA